MSEIITVAWFADFSGAQRIRRRGSFFTQTSESKNANRAPESHRNHAYTHIKYVYRIHPRPWFFFFYFRKTFRFSNVYYTLVTASVFIFPPVKNPFKNAIVASRRNGRTAIFRIIAFFIIAPPPSSSSRRRPSAVIMIFFFFYYSKSCVYFFRLSL